MRLAALSVAAALLALPAPAETDADPAGENGAAEEGAAVEESGGEVTFLDPLDDSPLEVPHEDVSDAVREFHRTAENPYDGVADQIAEGKKIYDRLCAACHLKDGTGRIGPSLVDDQWQYERTGTDKGMFEVIWAGAAGAMQPFRDRLSQDEILQVMAYLDELKKG